MHTADYLFNCTILITAKVIFLWKILLGFTLLCQNTPIHFIPAHRTRQINTTRTIFAQRPQAPRNRTQRRSKKNFKVVKDTINARCLNHCSNLPLRWKTTVLTKKRIAFYNKAVFEFGASQKSFKYWEMVAIAATIGPVPCTYVIFLISFELIQIVMSCATKNTHILETWEHLARIYGKLARQDKTNESVRSACCAVLVVVVTADRPPVDVSTNIKLAILRIYD